MANKSPGAPFQDLVDWRCQNILTLLLINEELTSTKSTPKNVGPKATAVPSQCRVELNR